MKKFILYSDNIKGIKEYEKKDGEYIKLENPIELKMSGVYVHSFSCTLNEALKNFKCLVQIFKFQRFYHSIINKNEFSSGTKFNILLLPIVYLYSIIDQKMLHKIKFI